MQAKEQSARAERDASGTGRKSAISSPCGRVWERGARYESIRTGFADLVSESESADVRSKVHARIEIST